MNPGPWPRPLGLLLDMDGTLVDTEPVWFTAEQAAVARFGGHLPDEAFRDLLGLDARGVVDLLIRRFGADTDATTLRSAIGDEVGTRLPTAAAMPGAPELVEAALGAGVRVAVVSNSPRIVVEATLAAHDWARPLAIRVSADDAERPKPAPDLYRLGLRRIGVPGPAAVAIEDSPTGARAAVAAGLRCLALVSSHVTPDDLRGLTPHLVGDLFEAAALLSLAPAWPREPPTPREA